MIQQRFWFALRLLLLALTCAAPDCTPCAANCQRDRDRCVDAVVLAYRGRRPQGGSYKAERLACSAAYEACLKVCLGGDLP